jgi:hypothetical protein
MQNLIQWSSAFENALAVVVAVGVALFLACCLECTDCPSRDKDDIFRHRAM